MTRPADLSELQLAIMRVIWDAGEISAAEAHRALYLTHRLAPTTVSTLLARLEKRGMLAHRVEGRTFMYRARVSESEVRRTTLRAILSSLFAGDPSAMLTQLVSGTDVGPGDIARMKAALAQAGGKARRSRASRGSRRSRS